MIANLTDKNMDKQVSNLLDYLIKIYRDGEMMTNKIHFQLFIMCASQIIGCNLFYQLTKQQIIEYFRTVRIFTPSEAVIIIRNIISRSETQREADLILKKVFPSIRCTYKQVNTTYYLSPCCCENLYNFISNPKYQLKNGSTYRFNNLFNFQSDQMIKMRISQEKYPDLPQYPHSIDTCLVIGHNNLIYLCENIIENEDPLPEFDKEPARPTNDWYQNIHSAAEYGSIKSIQYDIFLVPLLRNHKDERGDTPAHVASRYGQIQVIETLRKLNAKFNLKNNSGNLPIHLSFNIETLEKLVECGCSIYDLNEEGKSLIEIKSNPFKEDVIKCLFKHGFNLFLPNPNGLFWAQYVIHNNYYTKNKDIEFIEFQKFLYPLLKSNLYKENEILQKILKKKSDINIEKYAKKLRKAVCRRDMKEIETYMGIGTPPDTEIVSKLTNLLIVSRKGDFELVKLFVNNYCDPNKVNDDGENAFWLSAINNYFDISTLLKTKFNANTDIVSNSGQTLMHIAYENKSKELFYYLLDVGASPNIFNNKHETVQFQAFLNRDDEVAEIIQNEFCGNINVTNQDGNSLGHLAILENDIDRLEYILNRNLDVEIINKYGHSLFMCSIMSQNNIPMCQFILDRGANINFQDNNGCTPFYFVCADKKFNRSKFDFLLKNNANINIQNNKRDFPISQLIKKDRKEEALILIDRKAAIIDNQSKTEPICIAVSKHDEFWFEKLVECGANGMNQMFPLIEKYLEEPFFKFETLKKMIYLNAAIGVPIQVALRDAHSNNKKEKRDVAIFLWENSSPDDQVLISKSIDKNHQTPLMVAIYFDDQYFLEQLVKPHLDLSTPDKVGRTPFINVCVKQLNSWMVKMADMLSIDQLNAVDCGNDSALTFVANNGNRKFADYLFVKEVHVTGINLDKNGIIQHYRDLIKMHKEMIEKAIEVKKKTWEKFQRREDHFKEINSKYNTFNNRRLAIEGMLYGEKSDFRYKQLQNEMNELRALMKKEEPRLNSAKKRRDDACTAHSHASNNLKILRNANRSDLLNNINGLKQYTSIEIDNDNDEA